MGFLKNWINKEEDVFSEDVTGDEYYELSAEEALQENDGNSKMILLEPRAYSESQQIADHLKARNTVNAKITKEQTNEKFNTSKPIPFGKNTPIPNEITAEAISPTTTGRSPLRQLFTIKLFLYLV